MIDNHVHQTLLVYSTVPYVRQSAGQTKSQVKSVSFVLGKVVTI